MSPSGPRVCLVLCALVPIGCSAFIDGAIDPAGDEGSAIDARGGAGGASSAGAPADETATGGAGPVGTGSSGPDGPEAVDVESGGGGRLPAQDEDECGSEDEPTPSGCPEICARCTTGGAVCVVDCDDHHACEDATLSCPPGLRCEVQCSAGGCRGATIACPAGTGCSVSCVGDAACENATIACSASGPCDLECGPPRTGEDAVDPCTAATMHCGDNACTCAAPHGGALPAVECADSCACEVCE